MSGMPDQVDAEIEIQQIFQACVIIDIIMVQQQEVNMANLIVRNLDTHIVDALRQRAVRHGRSAEAEHRAILEEALLRPRRKPLTEVLASIPNVGEDADFERVEEQDRLDVFD